MLLRAQQHLYLQIHFQHLSTLSVFMKRLEMLLMYVVNENVSEERKYGCPQANNAGNLEQRCRFYGTDTSLWFN